MLNYTIYRSDHQLHFREQKGLYGDCVFKDGVSLCVQGCFLNGDFSVGCWRLIRLPQDK